MEYTEDMENMSKNILLGESLEMYLERIGATENMPITEEEWMQECNREDAP